MSWLLWVGLGWTAIGAVAAVAFCDGARRLRSRVPQPADRRSHLRLVRGGADRF